jgi:hypothetical protein
MPIYNWLQKTITRRWRRNVEQSLHNNCIYLKHINKYKNIKQITDKSKYFEYGVARDLFSNLVNYSYGIKQQLAIDIHPLASLELVNDAIVQLNKMPLTDARMTKRLSTINDFSDLRDSYGIDYRAPADARSVQLPDMSIDWIATTSTLEHIPVEDIRAIHKECYRVLKNGGIMTHQIDYSDHYSHCNRHVSPFMFLKFSDSEWSWWHMRHYYTNRLRHIDHRSLLTDAGFVIVNEESFRPANALELLDADNLNIKFKNYTIDDLIVTEGFFVCRKP